MPLATVASCLERWSRDPRAVRWTVQYRFGFGAAARQRTFDWYAPASERGAIAVLTRMHNGILLLQPLSVVLGSPLSESRLVPWLDTIRAVHALPISLTEDEHSEPPAGVPLDLPAVQHARPKAQRGLAVGLDIGGTGMKVCALRGNELVAQAQGPTWPGEQAGLPSLVARARGLVREVCGAERATSLGVGLASPMGVHGQVVSLSTVMRQKLGSPALLEALPARVAQGLIAGPVASFNDLANLGRMLSGQGHRRLLRLQIGTSFGGCWIDADGTVSASELGRLVVDLSPEARPHTYLPLKGAMKSYLSNHGVARSLALWGGDERSPAQVGFAWRDLNRGGDPLGAALVSWTGSLLVGAIREALAVLPGLEEVSLGGGMLQGVTGRLVARDVVDRLKGLRRAPRFALSANPGFDGAIAAAQAPLIDAPLRGVRRLVG